MKNIRLDLAYDGTNFSGWQIQKNSQTIEEELQKALKAININFDKILSSGRTDAGVHANQHTTNFLTTSKIPAEKIALALNTKLPDDVRALKSFEVDHDFHSRYSALGKYYSYYIDLKEISNPIKRKYSWHFPYSLDLKKVNYAADFLSGKHDYINFRSSGSDVKTTIREVFIIKPEFLDNTLKLNFVGNGFLYNMVRILTGTIIQYGNGIISTERLNTVFNKKDRTLSGITAPAKGLFLEKALYSPKEKDQLLEHLKSKTS